MSYEIRGSMLVFQALAVTATFSPICRRAVFILLTAFFVYCGDLLGEAPFFVGALLADMSLVIGKDNQPTSSKVIGLYPRAFRVAKNNWPIAIAMFALFLSSFPTDSPERAAWSLFLDQFAVNYFPSSRRTPFICHF
jgi:hypothetical protein